MHLSSLFLQDLGSTGDSLSLDSVQHVRLIVSPNLLGYWGLPFRPVAPFLRTVNSTVPPRDDQFALVSAKELVAYELLVAVGTVADYSTYPSNLAERPLVDLSG